MIAVLLTLITAASAQDDATFAFAQQLVNRMSSTKGPSIIFFTAEDGKSCRPALDAIGMLLARDGSIHHVDGTDARVLDFLRSPSNDRSEFHKFAEFIKDHGFVLSYRSERFEDRIAAKIGTLASVGEDRQNWGAVDTKKLTFLFETRLTARFTAKHLVRDITRRSFVTTTLDGCTYHFVTVKDLAELDKPSCEGAVSTERSGWYREEQELVE